MSALERTPLVEVEDLRVTFGSDDRPAISHLSFVLRRGECLALVGETGSGKSVTARALIGAAGPGAIVRARKLRVAGQELASFVEQENSVVRPGRVAFVLQDTFGSLDPRRTVEEEVGNALDPHHRLDRRERRTQVLELLNSLGVPRAETRSLHRPHQLSGGFRQCVLLARAIAQRPELLILDEPTSALGSSLRARLLELLESVRTDRNALLLVSHDLAVVRRLATHVAVLHRGHIVEQGSTAAVFAEPQHPYTRALLSAGSRASSGVASPSHARSTTLAPFTPPNARVYETPSSATSTSTAPPEVDPSFDAPRSSEASGSFARRVVLRAQALTKTFPGSAIDERRAAVSDVSFTLEAGKTLGIIGESGSGKTTLLRLLLGLETPDRGHVEIGGSSWNELSAAEQRGARRRIQAIFENVLASFDPRYTVERAFYQAPDAHAASPSHRRQRLSELLTLVRLDAACLQRRPFELSGGQLQRVALLRALALDPEILVCDESLSALDAAVQAEIVAILNDLKRRLGLAIVFVSHDLDVIRRISDRILVLERGELVESGDARVVFDAPRHPHTVQLLQSSFRHDSAQRSQPHESASQDRGRTSQSEPSDSAPHEASLRQPLQLLQA